MAENFYDKVKKQIDEQTRDKLNIRLNAPISVKFKSYRPQDQDDSIPDPIWKRTHYVYDRGSSFPIDVISFKDYYGNIFGPTDIKYQEGSFYDVDFDQYINVRYRIDVWCTKKANIPFSWKCAEGNIHFSLVDASTHTGTVTVLHSDSLVEAGSGRLILEPNKWFRLNLCYYCNDDDGWVKFTCALKDYIAAWRSSDLTPPAIPEWASPTIETTVVDPKTGASKVTLYWSRNTEEDFAGNGIYRRTVVDSRIPVVPQPVDPLLFPNAFYVGGRVSATLKTGGSILLENTGTIYSLNAIHFRPANLQPNGDFHNDWGNWSTSGTISISPTQYKLAYKAAKLQVGGTSDISSITSTFLAIATVNDYTVSYYSSFNFIANEGFEAGATGWGNIGTDFTIATTGAFNGNNYLKFVTPAEATYSRCNPFYVKQNQFLNVSCYASTATSLMVLYLEIFGANWKVFYFPTAGRWSHAEGTFKASMAGSCQLRLGSFSSTSGKEIWFDDVSVFPSSYQGSGTNTQITSNITTYFYDSGKSPCGTAWLELTLVKEPNWDNKRFVLPKSSSDDVTRIPSDCSYLKVKFDLSCGATYDEQAVLFLDGIYVKVESGVDSYVFNPTTIDASFLSVGGTVTQSPGGNIYQVKYTHQADRDLVPTDTGTISWNDLNVQSGITYSYVLDAYDVDGNRSLWSAEASIVAGDIVAPGTVRGLTGEADYLSVNLKWTNPTSEDYLGAKVYITSTLAANLYAHELGLPNEKEALIAGGLSADTEYKFLVLSYDRNFNTNTISPLPSVNITTLAEPEGEINKVAEITFDSHPTFSEERLHYGLGTFNFYVHFSQIIAQLSDISINIKDEDSYNLYVGNSLKRHGSALGTVNVVGSFNVSSVNPEGWANVYVQATDINGSIHYGVRSITIDKTAPTMVQLEINDNKSFTDSLDVKLRIRATGDEVCFSNYYVLGDNSAIPGTVSPWYSNGSIFNWKMLGPSNEVGTKGVYGWTRDRALNVSENFGDNIFYNGNIPPEAVIFFLDAKGGNRIEPNEFNWFNQVIFATFETKTFGYSLSTIWYRNKLGASSWSAWSSVQASNFVATTLDYNGTIEVEAYCVTLGGLRSNVQRETAYQDKVDPVVNNTGLWQTTKSRIKGAWLVWDNSKLTDALSGMGYTNIYRSNTSDSADATLVGKNVWANRYFSDFDANLNPFDTYYYFLKAEDKASNLSVFSNGTAVQVFPNYKEEYSNYLDNSNFERINYDGHPVSWEVWYGIPATVTATTYMGNFAIKQDGSNLYRTEYTYLPAWSPDRNFVLSCYCLGSSFLTKNVCYHFNFFGINNELLSTILSSISFATMPVASGEWKRIEHLFPAASIPVNAAHCKLTIYGYSVNKCYIDCIQFEEKDSLPASEYNETKAVSGDRMMAHFIRGDMIEAESIRTTELTAHCITATLIEANAINVDDGQLSQIRVGPEDDYHTLLKNRGLVFKKGTSEFGFARRVHQIQDVQVGTIKYEDYGIASFDNTPKVSLFPRFIKTYESAWAGDDQFTALYPQNITGTNFEAKAMLYRGATGILVNTATYNDWQDGDLVLRPNGQVGTAQYQSTYDALLYSFGATANWIYVYGQFRWENNDQSKEPYLKFHTLIGEYDSGTSRMYPTIFEGNTYFMGGYMPTGTYYYVFGGAGYGYISPAASSYDVKVSISTYNNANFPPGSLHSISITSGVYKYFPSLQEIGDARVDCLIIET